MKVFEERGVKRRKSKGNSRMTKRERFDSIQSLGFVISVVRVVELVWKLVVERQQEENGRS